MKPTAKAVRWEPATGLPELPLAAFDMRWSADGRLACIGLYQDLFVNSHQLPAEGIVIEFEGVHAFMSFDEFSDVLEEMGGQAPELAEAVPYGGCWPFAEILASPWLVEIANRDGAQDFTDYRHWAVLTGDQTLHVMAHSNSEPKFAGWLNRPPSE